MKAWLCLRDGVHYRREAFEAGLRALGYQVQMGPTLAPGPDDILVLWNRYGRFDHSAREFESRGLPVLVAENGYLGNAFAGDRWYSIARSQHNGAGEWHPGGPERWDALGEALAPWHVDAGELVLLPQRGIGPAGVAMPLDWAERTQLRLRERGLKARIRPHPGTGPALALEADLAGARAVVTWGSGAAIKALAMGVPVFYDLPRWIGAPAARPLKALLAGEAPRRDDAARLDMFRALAWAQWRLGEISNGEAFRHLLGPGSLRAEVRAAEPRPDARGRVARVRGQA